jgi:hypothetical protein
MMTVYDALVEAIASVIDVQVATSIDPSLPVAYLSITATTTRKYGHESTGLLSVGAKTKEALEALVSDIREAIGSDFTASDGRRLDRVTWNAQDPVLMLDGTWGQRINLKILHWEA